MIVFCHLLNDNSGSPRVLRSAIEALADDSDSLEVSSQLYIGSQGRGLLETVRLPVRRYWYRRSSFRLVTLFTLLISQVLLYRQLSRARDISPDAVVYANTLLPFGAMLWARLNGRRVICHVHEVSVTPAVLRRFLTSVARRNADLLLYVSEDQLERLPIVGPAAVVIPNPVDPTLQELGEVTPYSPRRSGRFEVLMLASPRDFKGIPEFIGLAQALADRRDISFSLVLNAEAVEIEQYMGGRALPSAISIYPRTEDPSRFYAVADLVVNLSRVDLCVETFGLTLVEAMSFGVPVIAPPVGGPVEVLGGKHCGLLIDSRNHGALVAAVKQLAGDPALCATMSEAARQRARAFSRQAFARSLRGHVAALSNRKDTA